MSRALATLLMLVPAAVGAIAPEPAQAETAVAAEASPALTVGRYPLVVLSQDRVAGPQVLPSDGVIAEIPLRLDWSARVARVEALEIGGVRRVVRPDTPIPGFRILEASGSRRLACAQFARPTGADNPADARGKRYDKEQSLCLLDSDLDGQFEAALAVGARWAEDRGIKPIRPLAYAFENDVVTQTALRFRYSGDRRGGGTIKAYYRIAGVDLPLVSLSSGTPDNLARQKVHLEVAKGAAQQTFDLLGATLLVTPALTKEGAFRFEFKTDFPRQSVDFWVQGAVTAVTSTTFRP